MLFLLGFGDEVEPAGPAVAAAAAAEVREKLAGSVADLWSTVELVGRWSIGGSATVADKGSGGDESALFLLLVEALRAREEAPLSLDSVVKKDAVLLPIMLLLLL